MELIKILKLNKTNLNKLSEKINFNNWYYRIGLFNKPMEFDFLKDFKNDIKGNISTVEIWYNAKNNSIEKLIKGGY